MRPRRGRAGPTEDPLQPGDPAPSGAALEEARAAAEAAMHTFAEKCGTRSEKALTCLTKDRDALPAFHDFAAGHWGDLLTCNPFPASPPPSSLCHE